MYYGTITGERYPKEIYNRLSDEKKEEFIEIDDDTMRALVNKANETNCDIVPNSEGYPSLQAREVDKSEILTMQINSYKRYLSETDWVVAKCYELGLTVSEEYPDIYALRVAARTQINELQAQLESL